MFLRAFLSYCILSLESYNRQQWFQAVTLELALDYLLRRYMLIGLGRKN